MTLRERNNMAKPKYIPAVGRRRKAVARIRLFKTKGETLVNQMPLKNIFQEK